MEKWKAKNASHFPTPTTATGHIYHPLRYTNNLAGTKDRAGHWVDLDLPHDWSIGGPFREDNPSGPHGAYLPGGIGWYRKKFTLPDAAKGKQVSIEFDGVYMNSDVWVNGHHLGKRPYGYVSFIDSCINNAIIDAEGFNPYAQTEGKRRSS